MMENILGFPASTIYDKPVQKVAFYKHMEMNSKMKQHFVDDVAEMNWLYKLAPSTLNVSDGKRVHEIVVFVVRLKVKDCPLDVFTFIDKMMPRYILFVLEYEGEYRLLLNYKEAADAEGATFRISRSFVSDWTSCGGSEGLATLHLTIEGNDMDAVYEHFAGAISGFGTHSHAHTQRIIELQTLMNAKARHAESLQKKIRAEKQFNKQMELNGEARKIKREIAELKKEMEEQQGGS